ncbi:recombinase family protein [Pseudoflavonifractor sp. 60]|uniref:recombinase family protein n=1 Tax=Pseudoflavonifractor sp. 60 TaxID=2304576 RepID=UPI0013705D3A|nr:recombinase family protein [Pseudoflavonifractor sp. 60]NBI67905.1 recombinase family protein [Pseudoflavonifractor sp. 60]
MTETAPRVIVIPAKPELIQAKAVQRQLRVAAYCRVSTDSEEQLTSYEAQKNYYTDKIMTNPDWTMAGIYADEGITGTSARKRPEFLKMIRKCRQKKIDLVLVKSISRFARNTVDCLNYMRVLKSLGIAIIFEEQNINTLETDSEMLITMMGAFAQAESESLSGNVQWGKRQAMREGKVHYQYRWLYAYEKGEDGKPKIIPEQAEVVKRIYDSYLAGHSLRMIKEALERDNIRTVDGGSQWSIAVIRGILKNEKYCGDALMQKTFTQDCISKKQIRNVGQLPMYYAPDSHEGIVSRDTYNAVQAEMARRNARKAPSRNKAPTGRACYSAKYALTERLVCGECGTLYRRCVWSKRGTKRVVWRCASRVDYGTTYCRNSPTLDEKPLQEAILAAVNSAMSQKETLISRITSAMQMELAPVSGKTMSAADIDRRLSELNEEFQKLFAESRGEGGYLKHADKFKRIADDMAVLKEKKAALLEQQNSSSAVNRRIQDAVNILSSGSAEITEWDESMIRQLVDTVKVLSAERIKVYLHGGIEIEQTIRGGR